VTVRPPNTLGVMLCVVSNTLQCESLAQGSVVSGRKLVVQRAKHCLALNWFVVFDLSCGHNLQTSGATNKTETL